MKFTPFFRGYEPVLPELALCLLALYLVGFCLQGEVGKRSGFEKVYTQEQTVRSQPNADIQVVERTAQGKVNTTSAEELTVVLPAVGGGFCSLNEKQVADLAGLQQLLQEAVRDGKLKKMVLHVSEPDKNREAIEGVLQLLYRMQLPVQLEKIR